MSPRTLLLAAAFLALSLGSAHAALQFAEKTILLKADTGQPELSGKFHFSNGGKEPVTVVNLTSSCGCTVATLEQKTYKPGESGDIIATFTTGEREGHQRKNIVVQTNEPNDNLYELTVEADIPPIITVAPRLLVWKQGAPTAPQAVTVTYAKGFSYRLVSAIDDSKVFVAESVTVPGRVEPEIRIRPTRTDEAVLGVVLLEFVGADGVKLQRSVLMRVINAP